MSLIPFMHRISVASYFMHHHICRLQILNKSKTIYLSIYLSIYNRSCGFSATFIHATTKNHATEISPAQPAQEATVQELKRTKGDVAAARALYVLQLQFKAQSHFKTQIDQNIESRPRFHMIPFSYLGLYISMFS